MRTNIIVGENYEFELVEKPSSSTDFLFKVLDKGVDTGHKIRVHLYGGISIPNGFKLNLSHADRNKLSMAAVRQYKSGLCF